jgi:hypothetical protein
MKAALLSACCAAICLVSTAGAAIEPDPRAKEAVGQLRVLVIRTTWGPAPADGGDLTRAADFYRRASFGRLQLKIERTPWLRSLSGPLCPTDADLAARARAAAAAAGYDLASYARIAYVLPEPTCSISGLGVGREVFLAMVGGAIDDIAFVHELGHTFGLPHARSFICPRGCTRTNEYADPFSPMGSGDLDFSALEKWKLGWIGSVQRVDRTRRYAIGDIDAPSTLPQALVVPTRKGEYWIERRSGERRLIVRLVKPDNPFHPVYLRSIYVAQPADRFVVPKVFSVTGDFAFKWLGRRRR